MSEVLQSQDVIKLYENEYPKPDLSNSLEHYGILGMKWGVRRYQKKNGSYTSEGKKRLKKKSKVKAYEDPKEALEAKDLKYINKNKNKYTTKEINQVLSRVDAEKRLSEMAKKQSSSKAKTAIKKMFKSKAFKMVAAVAVGSLIIAGRAYYKDKFGYPRKLEDFSKPGRAIVPDAMKIFPEKLKDAVKSNKYAKYFR